MCCDDQLQPDMSFRKRGEIIGGPRRVPARGPIPGVSTVPRGGPLSRDAAQSPASSFQRRPLAAKAGTQQQQQQQSQDNDLASRIMQNPGVRPSLSTSQPTTSTGSSDLDKILSHQGLPLGNSLLIEESGTTDFASVLLRAFAAQGIMHNRITANANAKELHSHVIVLGMAPQWANDLPGLYKGSSKEQKKAKIAENESKVSVSNIAHGSNLPRGDQKMKIAWRYGLNAKDMEKENDAGEMNAAYEHYSHQFDLTSKLQPGPNPQEISFVPISDTVSAIIKQLKNIVQAQLRSNPLKTVRLVIPGFLNPSIYPPQLTAPTFAFPLIHSLRSLLRQFENNLVMVSSLALDLYPRQSNLTGVLESLFDSSIHLQPFNQEMSQWIERAYKNEPAKIQQGLVDIIKIPVLSERGLMMVHTGEFAFKNGRKRFEIEEWGIPVEVDSKEEAHDNGEKSQTTKNIDF